MIKVTKKEDAEKGITAFFIECQGPDDHETLDKFRVAIIGDVPKMANYENSNTLVLQAKIPTIKLS